VRDWRPDRLAGAIERFTALWARVLDTWYDISADSHLDDERREALALMTLLLPARMLDVYAGLSPKFWPWLRESQRDRESPAGTSESRGPC
jgi:hypothetical protein